MGPPMSTIVSLRPVMEHIRTAAHSWEGTVVPQIALVREAIAHETELALLDILLNGVPAALCQILCFVRLGYSTVAYRNSSLEI